jgi:hypothetical protein
MLTVLGVRVLQAILFLVYEMQTEVLFTILGFYLKFRGFFTKTAINITWFGA